MGKWQTCWRKKNHIPAKRVEQCGSIDSGKLYDNRIRPFEEGEDNFSYGCRITLFNTKAYFSLPNAKKGDYPYATLVEETKCNYGGTRHWFLCPNQECKRRCKKLYIDLQGYFLCRKCLKLAYLTQNRSKLDRIIDKKWQLIHKLGSESCFILDSQKPKGMHWKTFDGIKEQIVELDDKATLGIAKWYSENYS